MRDKSQHSVVVSTPIPTRTTSGLIPSSAEYFLDTVTPVEIMLALITCEKFILNSRLPSNTVSIRLLNNPTTTYQVDVILRLETMRHNRHRSGRIRGKVNSDHMPWKRKKGSNETRILFGACLTFHPNKKKGNLPYGNIHYCIRWCVRQQPTSKIMTMVLTVPASI